MNRIVIPASDIHALRSLGCTQLAEELDGADIVPPEHVPEDVVTMHAQVRYVDESTDEQRSVVLVYPHEVDVSQGRISVLSPVGAALLGLATGQSIDWTFPNGRRRLRVAHVAQASASRGAGRAA